jgi:hypothetical protein
MLAHCEYLCIHIIDFVKCLFQDFTFSSITKRGVSPLYPCLNLVGKIPDISR